MKFSDLCPFPLKRVCGFSFVLASLVMLSSAQAQTETKSGKFVELVTKGRTQSIIVEVDGEKHEIKMTPKVNFAVYAPGDKGFVRAGQYIEGKGVVTNEKLFLNEFAIHLVAKGKRLPNGQIMKADGVEGQSANAYFVSGPIVGIAPDKDYPDYQNVAIKFNGPAPPVILEKEFSVWVYHFDPATAPADADVELTVKPLAGGKFLPLSVKVFRDEEFDSTKVFDEEGNIKEDK